MRNLQIYTLTTILPLFLLFNACKKDNNDQVITPDQINNNGNNGNNDGTNNGDSNEKIVKTDLNLSNRSINNAFEYGENTLAIVWGDTVNNSLNIEIEYSDANSGQNQTVEVEAAEDTSFIEGLKLGEIVKYRTSFIPQSDSVSKLFSSQKKVIYTMKVNKDLWGEAEWSTIDPPLPPDDKIKLEYVWDGVWSSNFNSPYGNYTSTRTSQSAYATDPTWVTIDLGQTVQLDSFNVHYYRRFESFCMRKYEIWGTTQKDNSPGWDNWTKLVEVENFQPSNQFKKYTEEDENAWVRGGNGTFDWNNLPEVRYIRIKCTQNYYVYWGEQGENSNPDNIDDHNMEIQELTFWQVIGIDD